MKIDAATHRKRSVGTILKAIVQPAFHRAALKTFSSCSAPFDFFTRYLTRSGSYPVRFQIKTPTGIVAPIAFGPDDILTINEIFFRGDYGDDRSAVVVVDFGSNIGVSALYFLSRNAQAFVYCHEPLPQNVERLKANLAGFEGRYDVRQVAVARRDAQVRFSYEPTGRYGRISPRDPDAVVVTAADSNRLLGEILDQHRKIHLLKIDIEASERKITARIPEHMARLIRRIVVEGRFRDNPLTATHDMSYRRPITTFRRRPGIS